MISTLMPVPHTLYSAALESLNITHVFGSCSRSIRIRACLMPYNSPNVDVALSRRKERNFPLDGAKARYDDRRWDVEPSVNMCISTAYSLYVYSNAISWVAAWGILFAVIPGQCHFYATCCGKHMPHNKTAGKLGNL